MAEPVREVLIAQQDYIAVYAMNGFIHLDQPMAMAGDDHCIRITEGCVPEFIAQLTAWYAEHQAQEEEES